MAVNVLTSVACLSLSLSVCLSVCNMFSTQTYQKKDIRRTLLGTQNMYFYFLH